MILLNVQNLSLTLGELTLENIDLTLHKNERLGLVAPNGTGKSTFLNAALDPSLASSGQITYGQGAIAALMSQEFAPQSAEATVHDVVLLGLSAPLQEEESWRADIALEDLRIPPPLWHRPYAQLSGGWQRLTNLARTWVGAPDIMLLDEPTNHLDLEKIALVQNWITKTAKDTAMIIVSHDRAFLEDVTHRTMFLRPQKSRVFDLPFAAAQVALEESDAFDEKTYANMSAKAQNLRRQAAKLKNIGINSGSDLLLKKTKQLNERAEDIESKRISAHQESGSGTIRLASTKAQGKATIEFRQASIETPEGQPLFQTGQLWINKGERIFVLGSNGCGKSSLLRRLIKASHAEDTAIQIAPALQFGIFDQNLDILNHYKTPFDVIKDIGGIADQTARTALSNAGIAYLMQDKAIDRLSGGQKARLAMVRLRLLQPNFYILDEPTNHLDLKGQEELAHELCAPDVSALMVSHDRAFIRDVGNRFWHIDGGKIVDVTSPEGYFDAIMSQAMT